MRDLGGHLADGRQLLGVAQVRLGGDAGRGGARLFLARVAQVVHHGVEAAGQAADLVVALGQHRARQVALGYAVDGLDQPAQRGRHPAHEHDVDREGEGHDEDEQQGRQATRRGQHLPADEFAVAHEPQERHHLPPGFAGGRVVQRNRHGVEGRDPLEFEEPPDGGVELGGLIDQAGPRVVGPLRAPGHGFQAKGSALAGQGDHPRLERLARPLRRQRLHAGRDGIGESVRLAVHVSELIRVQHEQHSPHRGREDGGHEQRGDDGDAGTELHMRAQV